MNLEKLIQGCLQHNRKAQFKLYEAHADMVIRICERYCPDIPTAQDVSQLSFLKVFKHLETFDAQKGAFHSWVKRITINECLQYLRKKNILQYATEISTLEISEEEIAPLPQVEMAQILAAVDSLPQGYKTVFLLSEVEEYSHKEISDQLGISETTSRSQLFKAKRELKKKLKTYSNENKITYSYE